MSAEERGIEGDSYCHECDGAEFYKKEIEVEGRVTAVETRCANCGALIEAEAVKKYKNTKIRERRNGHARL